MNIYFLYFSCTNFKATEVGRMQRNSTTSATPDLLTFLGLLGDFRVVNLLRCRQEFKNANELNKWIRTNSCCTDSTTSLTSSASTFTKPASSSSWASAVLGTLISYRILDKWKTSYGRKLTFMGATFVSSLGPSEEVGSSAAFATIGTTAFWNGDHWEIFIIYSQTECLPLLYRETLRRHPLDQMNHNVRMRIHGNKSLR